MRVCLTESDLLPKHFVFGCGRLVRDLLHIPIERKQVTARNNPKRIYPGDSMPPPPPPLLLLLMMMLMMASTASTSSTAAAAESPHDRAAT